MIQVWQTNRSPSVSDTIKVSGVAFDLSGSTVKLQMRSEHSASLVVDTAAVVVSAINGTVRYDWAVPDVATAGKFWAWWHVTLPSGATQDTPEFAVYVLAHADSTGILGTIAEVREQIRGIKASDTSKDAMLGRLLVQASKRCESYTSHRFAVETGTTKTYRYDGDVFLDLGPWDLAGAPTQVQIDTDISPYTLAAAQYRVEPRQAPYGVYTHLALMPFNARGSSGGLNFWGGGSDAPGVGAFGREVQVTANWGWTTPPEDLKWGVLRLVESWYANPRDTAASNIAGSSETYSRAKDAGTGLPDDVLEAWEPFRRPGLM